VVILSVAASSAFGIGSGISETSILLLLLGGVSLVGLPHGGLDHRVGTSLFSKFCQNISLSRVAFYVSYLSVAAAVVAGWYLMPVATVVIFFAMAAWHFGLEEEDFHGDLKPLENLGVAVRGGMVIWCACLFRPAEVTTLLNMISPLRDSNVGAIVSSVAMASPVFFVLLAADFYRCYRRGTSRTAGLQALRLVSFMVMFAVCPVLLSFAIYFCGWHSIRGLVHLKESFQGTDSQFFLALVPMSLLAIALFAGGVLFFQTQQSLGDAAVRALFIGLSAVAVPHLLLHVAVDSLQSRPSETSERLEAMPCHT
jgi:Brp/Blh family beta-carotene 15,15'-monooxygenase